MPAALFLLCGTTASNACERPLEPSPRSLDWSSHKALLGRFAPSPAFASLDMLSGSTAELRAASVDATKTAKASLVGLAAATDSMRTGLSTGLGHSPSDAVPLQHGRHLAQISVSTVAAFESACACGGGANHLALPDTYAESADFIEARPLPSPCHVHMNAQAHASPPLPATPLALNPAPAPPLHVGNTGGQVGRGGHGHRDSVVAPCGCKG